MAHSMDNRKYCGYKQFSVRKCPPNLLAPLIKIVIDEIRKACKKQPVLCGFNPSDNAYEPLKLMQTVMAKTNEVCLRYLDNSMLCSLPSPGSSYFLTSVCAAKNTRRRMEDRHVIVHDLNTMFNIQEASPSSYYAIFDGHAGHDAAAYSSAHLHQFLAENKFFISNPEQALLDAFCKTDALFIDKCRVENLSSGTTAVVALFRPKEKTLYIAWVGDSQALLVNQGRLLQVVNPHKPSRTDERERIEKQGGCVLLWGTWRVNGQLAVSRAIGDADYKPYVIAVPDIREIPLDGGEDFLILACDGLWDFVSEDCAAKLVYNLVMENPDDTDRISQHLVQLSKEQGSSDNISVIVVFLREPSKIAAEAHWANRNCTPARTMEAGLDNANNPFAISNGGAATDNIISQKNDGLLLNLTDNFKQNGTDLSPIADFYQKEKSNGKRTASEFEDDDFGPETDVDAVDDARSPIETAKGFGDVFTNNNPAEGVYNPFVEHQEKAALEIERELQKQQSTEFEEQRMAREETPTPPADAVHDVSGLVENAAESESEDEWNYFKGDEANKENISPQPDKEVAEVPEEDDNMSQLNPNAAEFVPVSPTRSIPSPACRTLLNDQVISQSPRRATANDIDISLPTPVDFEKEVKSRPSDVDSYSNGHGDTSPNKTTTDLMEAVLNGKNIDEIPEFQPGSTPTKIVPNEEFHFGPNAAPFTPSKLLDQSEAAISTLAVYGDESTATLGTSFNESVASQDTVSDTNLLNKESDPMSMSFYADKGDGNPFDLNQVHLLPDNIDEFLEKPDNSALNDTISDLPDHHPLGEPKDTTEDLTLNNDDAIQITDLDKGAYYDEKELASPLEPEKELLEKEVEECDFSKTPEPTHENLLAGELFCHIPEKPKTPESLPRDVELISPEPRAESTSPRPESYREGSESKSPIPEPTEVADLLSQPEPEDLPRDVELISPDLVISRPDSTHEEVSKSPLLIESKSPVPQATEVEDLLGIKSMPDAFEVEDLLKGDSDVSSKSPIPEVCELPQSKTPTSDIFEAKSPVPGAESPVCELPESRSPVCELPVSKSPVCEFEGAKSPVSELGGAKAPVFDIPKSPVCERPVSTSPVCQLGGAKSPVCDFGGTKSPLGLDIESKSYDFSAPKSPVGSPDFTKEEELLKADLHFEDICKSEENLLPTREAHTTPEVLEMAQEKFEEIFKPKEAASPPQSPQEDVTSSLRDDVASPTECPILDQIIDDSYVADQSSEDLRLAQEIADTVQETILQAALSIPETCPIPTSKPVEDTESVITADMNSFLERSLPPDVASPLSPTEQELTARQFAEESLNEQTLTHNLSLDHPLMKCVYPLPPQIGEHIDIKTENISPEFAEQAIVTPSEESKQEDVPTAPLVEEPVKEPVVEEKKAEEQAVGLAAAAVAVAGATAAVAAAKASDKAEKDEKKKPGTSPAKKLHAAKPAPRSTATAKASAAPKPASRLNASPKTSLAKTSTAKPSTTTLAPKPATTKTSPRPRPATTSAPKSTEKKPLVNGDIKSAVKSTLVPKKTVSETTTARSATTRPPFSASSRLSPTKAAATPRPAAPRPATAPVPRTTATRTTASMVAAAPKPRPATLASKTTSATARPAASAKSPPTRVSPKATTAPRPRPAPTTSTTLSKPRVPLTKTITKANADTEKQNKESANKLTASRSVTSTTRTTSATARTTSTSTVRKIDSKVSATRTSKTTTTTMKSTTAKKPAEIVRHPPTKTRTTKVEKPKENGVSTVVTEEITVVSSTNGLIDSSEPQLLKDNSPVDNKLIIENTLIQTNTAD